MGYLHTLPPVKTHTVAVAYSGLIIAAIYMLSFFRPSGGCHIPVIIYNLCHSYSSNPNACSMCFINPSATCCSLAISCFLFIHAFIFPNTYFTLSSSIPHNNTDSSFMIAVTQRLGVFFPVSSCSAISA